MIPSEHLPLVEGITVLRLTGRLGGKSSAGREVFALTVAQHIP